jgi:hypothetical protein
MYCNVYQARLQNAGGLVGYVHQYLGLPIASTAPLGKISDRFVTEIDRFARQQQIPRVRFAKGQRKDDVMHDQLAVFEASGRTEGVVFIGTAQEKPGVFRTEKRRNPDTGRSYPWIVPTTGMPSHYYFYCLDEDFGPFFVKFCSYFPLHSEAVPERHHWAQRQAAKAGIGFTAMDNAFAAGADVAAVQTICDAIGPAHICALLDKWLTILPDPFTAIDRAAGYHYRISVLQLHYCASSVATAISIGPGFRLSR